ncbi:NAD-dependent epimerase/dehydratase family protein [Streptomyces canus]|uniref:NAD-dependent epimerase/dehydratase family protein n=1 Tax=Streptomyces canus TaxID=58343 RepID=UPI002E2853AE|nr:NAD-dependent epimerase/dehydratase family protein [Streptomyces canus]
MKKILVLGGSVFLGRAVATAALRRGHEVTTFNRGLSGSDVEGVEVTRGDRDNEGDLERLVAGRHWDAVIDTCGFVPRSVSAGARVLSSHADHYVFVSSVSAFQDWPARPIDEASPRWECPSDADESSGTYGPLKAGCERAVREHFDGTVSVVSPGIIVGPGENVGRLPWWLRRVAAGGALAPHPGDREIQLLDVRDLAEFILARVERPSECDLLVAAPAGQATFAEWLALCAKATGADPALVWMDEEFLLEQQVTPWSELPLWAPLRADWRHAWSVSSDAAVAMGLTCRPLADTVVDTWDWLRGTPGFQGKPKIGMASEKERRLLAAWRGKGSGSEETAR